MTRIRTWKNAATLVSMVLLASQPALASEYDMTEVNGKIAAITSKNLHKIVSAIEVGVLMLSPEFASLKQTCTTDWSEITANLASVQSGNTGRKLVLWAMQDLSAGNYATMLEGITTQFENGTLDLDVLRAGLFPEGRMESFIVDNYQHTRIVGILSRVNAKTADVSLKARIAGILGGSEKASLDDYREAHEGTEERLPPLVLIPVE